MAFGSNSFGSTAYAGNAGSPNPIVIPSTFGLTLTLHAPNIFIDDAISVGSFALGLTLHQPTTLISIEPSTFALTAALQAPALTVIHEPGTFALALTLYQPTVIITKLVGTLTMGVYAGFAPGIGSLQPTIVKFIKDPIVTGGCSQCGTLLWDAHENAIPIASERVMTGLNFDTDGGLPDNQYVRCARCGWINNRNRNSSHPRGSRAGWGISPEGGTEFEVIPNEPADEWYFPGQPGAPGTVNNYTP